MSSTVSISDGSMMLEDFIGSIKGVEVEFDGGGNLVLFIHVGDEKRDDKVST